ncbi:MAG: FAD-dependent oxidoreductase, partial [Solirubrobacterales bacterium]
MADTFDLIVIGGGPGGYVAAIRAAQLGRSTAVVEVDKPGGRCLNYACIPAKTVLHSAELYDQARNGAELGIEASDVAVDWKALEGRRAKVSEGLAGGVKMLWDKNKVTLIEGRGSLSADGDVEVGEKTYKA